MSLISVEGGHGVGGDPGAVGPSGLREADVTLAVSWKVREKLVAMGHDVLFCTPEKRAVQYQGDRAYYAMQQGAAAHLSIHCNAAEDPSAHGFEAWANNLSDPTGKSITLAQALDTYCSPLVTADRGVKMCSDNARTQAVCSFAGPAVIAELCFISNPAEESMLASDGWRESMASAIAQAIAQVFPSQPTSQYAHRAIFVPGSNVMSFDGRSVQLPQPVMIVQGSTFVPLRALVEAQGGVATPTFAPTGEVIQIEWRYN